MKRFHVHAAVANLSESIGFYSALFGATPTIERPDYAKWMLDDPRVNFAISTRGHQPGVNHLGFQAADAEELAESGERASRASGAAPLKQDSAACCYAKSDKYWVLDPQGLAWENFLTLGEIPIFGDDTPISASDGGEACCIPLHQAKSSTAASEGACCIPKEAAGTGVVQQGGDCC
ncbi:MAG: ArsI/CadI family heavy metal resistance metalloenzyme [Candidatus Binataceae bacterium]